MSIRATGVATMRRIPLILWSTVPMRLAFFACAILLVGSPLSAKPNVLLICVDDLKPTLGCYGDSLANTPNIDRLAQGGVQFERAYCNQAVCSPSRNALFTGIRPQTMGIYDLPTNFRTALPDAVTLPQCFKQNGYQSLSLGKMYHTGSGNHEDNASWTDTWNNPSVVYLLPESKKDNRGRGPAFEAADVADSEYPTGELADEAIRRLEKFGESGEPFFLGVGFRRPHLPFNSPQKYWDLYQREQFSRPEWRQAPKDAPPFTLTNWGELRSYSNIPDRGPMTEELELELIHGYYAAVSYVDVQVGRLIETLEQTGLADNTIVVLWGDHGWHLGDHGQWTKHTNYEQAARIPLLFAGPNIEPGVAKKSFIETVDIYPTVCELVGIEAPGNLDGKSFRQVIEDPEAVNRERAVHVFPRGRYFGQAVRTDRYRLVEWTTASGRGEPIYELYDYQEDPEETENIASQHTAVVAELKALLDELPEPKRQAPQRRRAG